MTLCDNMTQSVRYSAFIDRNKGFQRNRAFSPDGLTVSGGFIQNSFIVSVSFHQQSEGER